MPAAPFVVSVPDESYVAELADVGGVDLLAWDAESPHPRRHEIRLLVMPYMTSLRFSDIPGGLDALEAVQLQSAGFESFLPDVPEGVALCNAAGVHDASTAELALALTLGSVRRIPEFSAAQANSHWAESRVWPALADSRVLVLGYGKIGRAITRRLLPFEVDVTAVASRAREGDELVDRVHGIDELPDLVGSHDVVIVIVPLTAATRGLVDAELLARMPDGALLVNVARGAVVDTDALVAECASGRLRAAVDVTDPEPLPSGHPLWSTPGALITPHVGGQTTAMRPRAVALMRRQIERMRDGLPPDHAVNA